jgi:hypothetical protein
VSRKIWPPCPGRKLNVSKRFGFFFVSRETLMRLECVLAHPVRIGLQRFWQQKLAIVFFTKTAEKFSRKKVFFFSLTLFKYAFEN